MEASAIRLYEFGDFRVDSARRLCWKGGAPVSLTPRVFDTLLYLVEHRASVIDKERIMEAVWPDSIVEENNLTQNISALRRIFGEKPGSHRFIVTVPGRGYRFVAPVRLAPAGATTQNASPPSAAEPAAPEIALLKTDERAAAAPSRREIHAWLLLAAFLLLAGAVAIWLLPSKPPQNRAVESTSPDVAQTIPEKSVAVLPFDNLSDDPRNAYFAVAVQDEILSNLASLADLKVISRTSASLYKTGNPRNVREIGQQLGVAHLLEGSVQHSGNRVRVNAQLIDTRTDAHLWAQTYDRELADVLAIQSEIARAIADQLKAKISIGEGARLALKPTENAEAYLLYLRARELETRYGGGKDEWEKAIKLYEQARELDPSFALARARLSILISHTYQSGDPPRTAQARAEAEEALRLRPGLGEAQLALAYTYFRGARDYDRALKELDRAADLLPNSAEVPLAAAYIYKWQNKFRERIAALRRAELLDPRDSSVLTLLIMTQRWVRDWPEAVRTFDRIRALQPNEPTLRFESRRAHYEFQRTRDLNVLKKANEIDRAGTEMDPDQLSSWLYQTAALDRDYAAAERFLAQTSANFYDASGAAHPKIVHEALLAVAQGTDSARAVMLLEAARQKIETQLAPFAHEVSAPTLDMRSNLALLYALLGRKEEAIRLARQSVEMEFGSVEKNYASAALAAVYARTGETEKAINLIEHLLTVPVLLGRGAVFNMTVADLKWQWLWDPLRTNPRFQNIVSGPEPGTVY